MKKLGLIGGIGPLSTISYYRGIVYGVSEKAGGDIFPPLVIESLNVFEVMRMSSQGMLDELKEYLLKGIKNLAAAGADIAALTGNTPHIVFDELQALSPIPLVSIVDIACKEAQRSGYKKVALLGTIATMEGELFKAPFIKNGIEVIVPNRGEQLFIQQKLHDEVEMNIINNSTISAFKSIIRRMMEDEHIQAVVLGCTELPILFENTELPIPVLDTMELHIRALTELIMGNKIE